MEKQDWCGVMVNDMESLFKNYNQPEVQVQSQEELNVTEAIKLNTTYSFPCWISQIIH